MATTIEDIVNQLVDRNLAQLNEIRGCSIAEIKALEADVNVELPKAYREFMSRMGRGAGRLFRGTDVFLGRVRKLRGFAEELLEDSSARYELPRNAHVFYMHQGYVFLYFIADGTDDPAVWQYVEGHDDPRQLTDSFTQFLQEALDEAQEMAAKLKSYRDEHGLKSG